MEEYQWVCKNFSPYLNLILPICFLLTITWLLFWAFGFFEAPFISVFFAFFTLVICTFDYFFFKIKH